MMSPRTIRRKTVKKAFQFTLMVVGSSGLGKSTFINTLFETNIIPHRTVGDTAQLALPKTIQITPYQLELDEDGVKISVTIVDTPGFGDSIVNTQNFSDLLRYIETQYDDILAEESRIKRNPKFQDNRIHVVLYFIPPTGHALKELDIQLMKQLGKRVNVIPVIAKSDSLSPNELTAFKRRIVEDIEHYDIPIFSFPYDPEEDDPNTIAQNSRLLKMLPFTVIGAEQEDKDSATNKRRGRSYGWGFVEVDNPKHCDFTTLRDILLNSHLQDLKDITHDILYENYRTEKLSEGSAVPTDGVPIPGQEGAVASEDTLNAQVKLKEVQLRRDQERLKEKELQVKQEIEKKRQELAMKQEALRNLEGKMSSATLNNTNDRLQPGV